MRFSGIRYGAIRIFRTFILWLLMITSDLKFFGIRFFLPVVRVASRISWRFGRPYRCNFRDLEPYIPELKPGMVIVTRTNHLFSNLWIHGYWTHAGLVLPGNNLIEAVGGGVRESTLQKFFQKTDDFAIYEPTAACGSVAMAACEFAKKAVGLKYNFSFRRKPNRYYCSELIYLSFEEGVRTSHNTREYTAFGSPYWNRRFIITPDWLISSPLRWKRISIPCSAAQKRPHAPEHVPLSGRTGKPVDSKPGLFQHPGYRPLGAIGQQKAALHHCTEKAVEV